MVVDRDQARQVRRQAFGFSLPSISLFEKGETQGFIKVLADADSRAILGAAILGIEGDEAIHAVLDLMYAGARVETMTRAVHIHPTVAELLPTAFGELRPAAR